MKKKTGPKPKPKSQRARGKSLSFPASQADFLDSLEKPGPFVQELLNQSSEYQNYLKEKGKNGTL